MNKIDKQVFNGIRKTINRFREKPFHYFTEADIHSSLLNDIMSGGTEILTTRQNGISISFVHQEYPTNFRYEKKRLLQGYDRDIEKIKAATDLDGSLGDRGHYDLAVLNPDFVDQVIDDDLKQSLRHLINKDAEDAKTRKKNNPDTFKKEILYAIEVKFIHYRNARNKTMIEEIIKDNEKLRLAVCHSDSFIKPINIIFCTSEKMKRSDKKIPVIEKVKTFVSGEPIKLYNDPHTIYHSPAEVLTIFTESFIHKEMKKTEKPISNFDGLNTKLKWANDLINLL